MSEANAAAQAPAAPAAPAAAAPAAPAQAPAQVAAVETPAAPAAQQPHAPAAATWAKTGDAGLDMALDYIGQRGFGQEHPAVAAAMKGDFGLLRASLAGLGDKAVGYEAYVQLAESAYKSTVKQLEETEQKSVQAVLSVVGTPESWAEIHAWAKANADEDERAEINAMLAGGPRQAKAAAVYLRNLYEQANGTVVQPASALKETASTGNAPSAGGPITDAKEYARLVNELARKMKGRMEGSPEYQQLQQRRLMGRRATR